MVINQSSMLQCQKKKLVKWCVRNTQVRHQAEASNLFPEGKPRIVLPWKVFLIICLTHCMHIIRSLKTELGFSQVNVSFSHTYKKGVYNEGFESDCEDMCHHDFFV